MRNSEDPAEKPQNTNKSSPLKIMIIILAVLLVISAGGLAARYIYLQFFAPAQTTVTVPDNLIGEESTGAQETSAESSSHSETASPADDEAAVSQTDTANDSGESGTSSHVVEDKPTAAKLELYEGKPGDNQRFEVQNMLPGDSITKYYCVKAHHDADLELFFRAEITDQTKNLGDVLHIKVTRMETGKVLCDAPFSEIDGQEFSELLAQNAQGETTAYYQIDVSLDTSVGNEYQAAILQADFQWYVKDEGSLTPPQTGDNTNLTLWMILAASSLLLILLLLFGRRRKEAGQHG